jgi:hypothetical protein
LCDFNYKNLLMQVFICLGLSRCVDDSDGFRESVSVKSFSRHAEFISVSGFCGCKYRS